MDGFISGPVDIFKLGPFRSGTEGSRIRSTLVRIPEDREVSLISQHLSFYERFTRDIFLTTYPVRAKFVR